MPGTHPHGAVVQFARRPHGGGFHATGANAANTHGELFPFPSRSILAPSPPLERSQLTQAVIDVAAGVAVFLVLSITAVSVVASTFILLFVRF
jgi:hypothetical protein